MRRKEKLVLGVGVNDSETPVVRFEKTGNTQVLVWKCPFYKTWSAMLKRVYSERFHEANPSYRGCFITEDWLRFSTFKEWMESQDWVEKELDKDLLCKNNRTYCPEHCVFLHKKVNSFIKTLSSRKGRYRLGVAGRTTSGSYIVHCGNPFTNKAEHVGSYKCEDEAHLAWKRRKYELAQELIAQGYADDPRVAEALLKMYSPENVIE